MNNSSIQVWIYDSPYSTDPLNFDFLIHHIIFYSIYSPLVTDYKNGEITGLIAQSWTASEDYTIWKFKLKSNLHFENGDPITPEIVLQSLKRILFQLNSRNSKNGIVENILGINEFLKLNQPLTGLALDPTDSTTLIFQLTKPTKNFLSLISFGMYSIVHPSQYNPITGEWLNDRTSISSATYKITDWSNKSMVLKLRSNYQSQLHHIGDKNHKMLSTVLITWEHSQKDQSDLKYGTSDENLSSQISLKNDYEQLEFFGGTISEIRFARCLSYYSPSSPCYNIENRKLMRKLFYENLAKYNLAPPKSFFPLIMEGIEEIEENNNSVSRNSSLEFDNTQTSIININESISSNSHEYSNSFRQMAHDLKLNINFLNLNINSIYNLIELKPKDPPIDISINLSGIYIDKPQDDVQFMFKSKEGVMLPDLDGRIFKELQHSPVNLQKINELIWEQAIIWPITHYGIGFWAKRNKFNFEKLNLARSPTMFELISYN